MARNLKEWNRNVFGNIFKRKNRLLVRIAGIQKRLGSCNTKGLLKLEKKLRKDLDEVLLQEEIMRFQQSKEQWIVSGDRNTRFYHTAARIRKTRSSIKALMDNEGIWVIEEGRMKNLVQDYFSSLFDSEGNTRRLHLVGNGFPSIPSTIWDDINEKFTNEEITQALFDMDPCKAPGPDGFSDGFYQRTWKQTGTSVLNFANLFFDTGTLPNSSNDTFIALVPKVLHPERVSHLRYISLCNVGYKVVTKTMTNRLKRIMPKLICPHHSSFILGRQIVDNIVVYQEMLHTIRKKKSTNGYMVMKIDLEKAYDRLEWSFIRDTLEKAGFNDLWCRLIMSCVESAHMAILWNGKPMEWFRPSRGIR